MRIVALLLAPAVLVGCEDRIPSAPAAPSLSVELVDAPAPLEEGESASFRVLYSVGSRESPVTLRPTGLGGTASPNDYRLSPAMLELPAGDGVSGELTVNIEALADARIAEGNETLTLGVSWIGASATVPTPLEVVITDTATVACPGVTVSASALMPFSEDRIQNTRLTVEIAEGSGSPWMELRDTYGHTEGWEPLARFGIRSWQVTRLPGAIAHELDITWPLRGSYVDGDRLGLQLADGPCSDPAVIACDPGGCEVRPALRDAGTTSAPPAG